MKPRKLLPIFAAAFLLLASCAPQAPAAPKPVATQAPSAQPTAAPTSRGDQLQATDPAGVSLASGRLQLVEFFRFT